MTTRQLKKLSALLERVRKATEPRGKKTELADFLLSTPQALTDWLSGRYAPGGEVTLLMLEWVQAEEAKQQKTVAVLQTPPRQRPKKPQSSYEKKKLRPRKV